MVADSDIPTQKDVVEAVKHQPNIENLIKQAKEYLELAKPRLDGASASGVDAPVLVEDDAHVGGLAAKVTDPEQDSAIHRSVV